jgi:hypothetical protein
MFSLSLKYLRITTPLKTISSLKPIIWGKHLKNLFSKTKACRPCVAKEFQDFREKEFQDFRA